MSDLEQLLCSDFQAFAFRAFSGLHHGQKLERAKFLDFLSYRAQEFAAGHGPKRLIVSLPPRHAKTFFCSKALPAWILAHDPAAKIIIATYSESLARDIAYEVRAIMREPWYRKTFATRVAKDRTRVLDFATTAGGGVYGTSIDGSITGRGADFIIVDDPVAISDYANLEKLERVNTIFDTEICSRLNNPRRGRILVVAHRIHENDLAGHLHAQRGWDKIVLPFVSSRTRTFRFGDGRIWKRKKQEFLLPMYSKKDAVHLRKTIVAPNFELLYQQNVTASRRLRIEPEYFQVCSSIDPGLPVVLSVDPAQKPGESSSCSVLQAWGVGNERYVLIEQWRAQADYRAVRDALRSFVRRHVPSVVLIEDNGLGRALGSDIGRSSQMLVEMVTPRGSKSERLRTHIARIRAGQVELLPGPWVAEYIEELTNFPASPFDDQVDATVQFLGWTAKNAPPPKRQRAVGTRTSGSEGGLPPLMTVTDIGVRLSRGGGGR